MSRSTSVAATDGRIGADIAVAEQISAPLSLFS